MLFKWNVQVYKRHVLDISYKPYTDKQIKQVCGVTKQW